MPNFVFIVDGTVAINYFIPDITDEEMESNPAKAELLSAMDSNPIIIKTEEQIPQGYIWDGANFNSPNPIPELSTNPIIEEEPI